MTAMPHENALPSPGLVLGEVLRKGYYYSPRFSNAEDGVRDLVSLAGGLGTLYVPSGLDPELPVLVTEPSFRAPSWKPFDRPERIGWHNDFSTMEERPSLTLAWIAREDPRPAFGDWRIASCRDVLDHLERGEEGQKVLGRLRTEQLPFGYEDSGEVPDFSIANPVPGALHLEGLRFYARALREGAIQRSGAVPETTQRMILAVESAADAVGTTLPARTLALLVCHNWLCLHDRIQQSAEEGILPRKSVLCFVQALRDTRSIEGLPPN